MGHAYSSIIADFFARFKKIDGFNVYFLTGTDEHGLKIQRSAEKLNKDPKSFCDEISKTFEDLTKTLNLSNTDLLKSKLPSVIKLIICFVSFKSILEDPLVALDPDHPVLTK